MSWGISNNPMYPFMMNQRPSASSFIPNGYQQQNDWFTNMMNIAIPASFALNNLFGDQPNQNGFQNNPWGNGTVNNGAVGNNSNYQQYMAPVDNIYSAILGSSGMPSAVTMPQQGSIWDNLSANSWGNGTVNNGAVGNNSNYQQYMAPVDNIYSAILGSSGMPSAVTMPQQGSIWDNLSANSSAQSVTDDYNYTDKKELPSTQAGQFKTWGQDNFEKTTNGESVSEFDFIKNTTGKPVGEKVYKEKIVELAQDEIAIDDKNKDGKLSEKEFVESELASYKDTTNKKDYDQANTDGKEGLTQQEFSRLFEGDKNVYQKSFQEIDANKDGVIGENELYKAKFNLNNGQEKSLRDTFKSFDLNNDGFVDAKERAAVLAYGDKTKDGDMDGKINHKKLFATDWTQEDAKPALQQIHKFMFGES